MYLSKFTIFFLCLNLASALTIHAQNQFLSNKNISFLPHYGFVLKNKLETSHLSDQHPYGIELEYLIQTTGGENWQRAYNNPAYGLSLQYWWFDPAKRLGNQFGLIFFFKGYIYKSHSSAITYRIAGGGGLVGKRFDLFQNTSNNLLSSKANFVLNGRIAYEQKLSTRLKSQLGVDLLHFSNGSIKMPNGGINIPNLFAGLQYSLAEPVHSIQATPVPRQRYWLLMLVAAGGSKQEYPVTSSNHPIGAISVYGGRQLNHKSAIIAGAELFYDGTKRVWLDSGETVSPRKLLQAGIIAGHELSIHKISIITHLGYTFYKPVSINPGLYQRYGLRYYLWPQLAVNVAMRAHLGRADFVEWGLTYRLIK